MHGDALDRLSAEHRAQVMQIEAAPWRRGGITLDSDGVTWLMNEVRMASGAA